MSFFLPLVLFLSPAFAAPDAHFARVVTVKGHVTVSGKAASVKERDWLAEGSTAATGADGFLAVELSDKSRLSLARSSSLTLRRTPETKITLLELLAGKLRALVTKGKLNKEKLIVITKTAALGVRGTDFSVLFDPQTGFTTLATIEGEVAMAPWEQSGADPERALAGAPVMVAGGSFFVRKPEMVASLKKNGEAAGAPTLAGAPGTTAQLRAEEPGKIPAALLEKLRSDAGAFPSMGSDGKILEGE